MTLYSYRSTGYVTKFDRDGNVEASYQTSDEACTCPAGHRHTCRHRQMLPDLRLLADTGWFWDFDRKVAVDLLGHRKVDLLAEEDTTEDITCLKCGAQVDEHFDCCEVHAVTKPWRRL